MANLPHFTRCRLPGLDQVPMGMHACHFYRHRAELVGALVCSYAMAPRNDEQMSEVMHAHHCALQRPDDYWQVVPVPKMPAVSLTGGVT